MSQSFPNITGNSYIDSGILALQDRDNATLTWFYGPTAPSNLFENLVWNDITNKKIKWYHNSTWETIIDYGKNYITVPNLAVKYQPINSNLTNYSTVSPSGTGFITNEWIPLSNFFITKMWSGFKDNLGLKNLAYKSKLTPLEIDNSSISLNKLDEIVETQPVFVTGDVIISFNQGNKSGCIKLSKSSSVKYTLGATASNSTYKGDVYKNLYRFIWTNKFIAIYNSNGVVSTKGGSWSNDWNNNKQLELPCYDIPSNDIPKDKNIGAGVGTFTVTKSGYYEITLVGGGGGGAGNSAGTWGHQSLCCGAAGAGFKGTVLLNKNDVITYTAGQYGNKGNSQTDWGQGISEGGAGGDSFFRVNGILYVTAGGGGGGKTNSYKGNRGAGWVGLEPSGGSVTIHESNKFTNITSIKGADGYGTSSGNKIEVDGPFHNIYGRGGSAQGFGDNRPSVLGYGHDGYLGFKFLAPKEYGTTNSEVKTQLDNLYSAITYFMKY